MRTSKKQVIFRLIFMILCFIPLVTHAQAVRLKANSVAYRLTDIWGEWNDWSDWESCNIDISINAKSRRILIFSKKMQDYSISKMLPEQTDSNGKSMVFLCVDDEGLVCIVQLRIQHHPSELQLYVKYSNSIFVYDVHEY